MNGNESMWQGGQEADGGAIRCGRMNDDGRADVALRAVDGLIAKSGGALLVDGVPGAGKTEFALAAALKGIERFGDEGVAMSVGNRQTADALGDRVIRAVGAVSVSRPITTLAAIAFRVLTDRCRSQGEPLPKLINGAEQDALLRQVVEVHVRHARAGELCDTCGLMRRYFATQNWVDSVYGDPVDDEGAAPDSPSGEANVRQTSHGIGSTDVLFERGVNDAFVRQLRDMIARMDELGLADGQEDEVVAALGPAEARDDSRERLATQWHLAFALRREYTRMVGRTYTDEFRIDSSKLLVEGAAAVDQVSADGLPRMVVVDDFQDMTLAGLAFLERLAGRGVLLVLVGNPDEAVQTFRGSYPDYLFNRAQHGPIGAEPIAIGPVQHGLAADLEQTDKSRRPDSLSADTPRTVTYRDLIASRVSLSIMSDESTDVALPARPGKLPQLDGALPIERLPHNNPMVADGTVCAALYRSSREQLDDVVWRIKHAHLNDGRQWNDMAVIAHDNDTVRAFGERLRRDGVPVRYSAVTAPLKDDPSVQGLFALIELAQLKHDGVEGTSMEMATAARFVRSRVRALLESPLMDGAEAAAGKWRGKRDASLRPLRSLLGVESGGAPASLASVEAVMRAVDALDNVSRWDHDEGAGEPSESSAHDTPAVNETKNLETLHRQWDRLRQRFAAQAKPEGMVVDDSLLNAPVGADGIVNASDGHEDETDAGLGVDAMYLMLAFDGAAGEDTPTMTGEAVGSADCASMPDKTRRQETKGSGVDDDADARETHGDEGGDDGLADSKNDEGCPSGVLALLKAVGGGRDRHIRAFEHLWRVVDEVASGLDSLQVLEPQYVLGLAWDRCGVALDWQRQALVADADGRAANDRLDTMMRLFSYAAGSGAKQSVRDFMSSVRSMRVAADSLAKVAPIDQAVTLTTPAGSAGGRWPLVWMVQVTEGTWPNLAARNTMFGGEDLADVVLHGGLRDETGSGPGTELMRVLGAEQRGFLVALTRAKSKVFIGSVLGETDVPSDFLYVYLPELFDRERDANPADRDYAKVAGASRFAGLDADPRGLLTAARVELARQSVAPQAGSSVDHALRRARVDDAVAALGELAGVGVEAADPHNWAFVDWDRRADDQSAEDMPKGDGPSAPATGLTSSAQPSSDASRGVIVRLSPSQVDAIWGCPVCWMLENQFAGPRPSSAATNFGSLIHQVADYACKEGLDHVDYRADLPEAERIEAITERMMDYYRSIAGDYSSVADPAERYRAERKDEGARQALANIATYFVRSNTADYLGGNADCFEVGRLARAESERSFAGLFGCDDILAAYNAIEGVEPIGRDELIAIMGVLVGGWPDGMQADMRVRLTGRIDRVEWRDCVNGAQCMRVIDWKTGRTAHKARQMFNDLQLVCYQLGFAFPQPQQEPGLRSGADGTTVGTGSDALADGLPRREPGPAPDMPDIRQCELFDVELADAPARGQGAPETNFQPPLFCGGALNAEPFTPRRRVKKPGVFLDLPDLPAEPPQGVGERAWSGFVGLRGTQAVWALTMVARVFYAAAASRSSVLVAHPQPDHVQWCQTHHASYVVCPACAGQVDTVFETRRA